MKKFKIYLIFIMMIGVFFINVNEVSASTKANLNIKNGCSKYFHLNPNQTLYEHGSGFSGLGAWWYDQGELLSTIWINGSESGRLAIASTEADTITTAWYFLTNEKTENFDSNATLTIETYSGNQKICTAKITGFSTKTNNVKVALLHEKKESNLRYKGIFSTGGNNVPSKEIELKIRKNITTAELDTKRGTKKASATKQQFLKTNGKGEIIVDNSENTKNACKTITTIIKEYWGYVMVIAPILLIVVITLDFFKALSSGKDEDVKKAGTNTVKRVIAVVILLALPALLTMIFDWFGIEICI